MFLISQMPSVSRGLPGRRLGILGDVKSCGLTGEQLLLGTNYRAADSSLRQYFLLSESQLANGFFLVHFCPVFVQLHNSLKPALTFLLCATRSDSAKGSCMSMWLAQVNNFVQPNLRGGTIFLLNKKENIFWGVFL